MIFNSKRREIPEFFNACCGRNCLNGYEKGISAENCAENKLKSKGYAIIDRRIKTKYGEIDILAQKDMEIVAIEVKQRNSLSSSRECISSKQKSRISNAFLSIIAQRNDMFENYRIDVICLDSAGRFEHIENAFSIAEFSSF